MRLTMIFIILGLCFLNLSNPSIIVINESNRIFEREYNLKLTKEQEIMFYTKKYTKEYNLNYEIVLSLFYFESKMKYNVKNNKSSAYGLGQFIKSTGNWVAIEKLGFKNYNHYNSTIKQQVHMTCWYLNFLNKKYKNTEMALIAYNGFEYPNGLYAKRIIDIMINKKYEECLKCKATN